MTVRPAAPADGLSAIQAACPEAAPWPPLETGQCLVAEGASGLLGFIVWRQTAPDETEILNLAVLPAARRSGVASGLLHRALASGRYCFLEVRESNRGAREFYKSQGFQAVGVREGYYASPTENCIVMKKTSW